MNNGGHHFNEKREINGQDFHGPVHLSPEEDADHLLNLSLSLQPFVTTSLSPPQSLPVYRHVSPAATLNSPRFSQQPPPSSPPPPPAVPVYRQFFTADLNSQILSTRPSPSSPPLPPSGPVCRNFFTTETLNSPILHHPRSSPSPPTPPPLVPVYLQFFPTINLNSPILSPQPPPSPPPPPQSTPVYRDVSPAATLNSQIRSPEPSGEGDGHHPRPPRSRRNSKLPRGGRSIEIVPPYPWATNHRATVHSLRHLLSIQIHTITGDVQCKRCERNYEIGFDLRQKLFEIWQYIVQNKSQMYDRAPSVWSNPTLPPCRFCEEENSAKPIISNKKKTINWLFLLLGQMLGCCNIGQLKYFCKHTKNHRTGAKDRLLYLTYMGLCKQLDPKGPFDREYKLFHDFMLAPTCI